MADDILVGLVQALQHALLFLRKIADDTVQEQRRLVQQAFGRLNALDDDAARHRVQPRIFLRGQLAPREDDDRNIGQRLRPC